jgi:acyl carrier protein
MTVDGKPLTKENVAEDICRIIVTARPRLAGLINPKTRLTPELGVDSLAFIEVVIGIEEEFGISMGDMEDFDAERLVSVEDLADLVMPKLREAGR